ncbi:hypothetical protein L6452_35650 [Arctium lappa]|uniref:Uncharacterized protein n=1 Tax=Arctium lappa TaxID=4217 RepID=A0ACB8Y8J4_ARCLA|nr:hypothetical protein L6452_35650 [Arctium lappa]
MPANSMAVVDDVIHDEKKTKNPHSIQQVHNNPFWFLFSLREKKQLDFTLKVIGGDLSALPGVSEAIEETIKDAVEDSITWPLRVVIPIIAGDYRVKSEEDEIHCRCRRASTRCTSLSRTCSKLKNSRSQSRRREDEIDSRQTHSHREENERELEKSMSMMRMIE